MTNKYYINFGTGAGNFWVEGDIEEAKQRAAEARTYCQSSCVINEYPIGPVCVSTWVPKKYDPEEDPDEPIADFGDFGYYAAWMDC